MSEIQGGRWDNLLRRLFPVKGPAIAPALAPEIVPVTIVQPSDPTLHYLRGEKLFMGGTVFGAISGENSYGHLRNASENQLLVVTGFSFSSTGADAEFRMGSSNTAFGAAVSVMGRDSRVGNVITAGSIAGVLSQGSQAAMTGTGFRIQQRVDHERPRGYLNPIVLAPGDGVYIFCSTTNQGIRTNWVWWERAAEPGELT